MKFGYCRKPRPNEHWYGYMYDLFLKNGYSTIKDMEDRFHARFRIDNPAGIANVCHMIENETFPALSEAIKMTSLGCQMGGLSDGEGAKIAEKMIQTEGIGAMSHGRGGSKELRICPDCWNEDIDKYGEPYIHLSHNLPGVRCCIRHQTPLMSETFPQKRTLMKPWSIDEFTLLETVENDFEMSFKAMMDNETGLSVMLESVCPDCGFVYVEHPFSRKTGCGCPICNNNLDVKTIMDRRIRSRFGDEYSIVEMTSPSYAKIRHNPCGKIRGKASELLYCDDPSCSECMKLTPERLSKEYDPEEWRFFDVPDEDERKGRIHIRHHACGYDGYIFISQFRSKAGGYCPKCDNPQENFNISDIDPDYEIVGEYRNNREPVKILHKKCGIVFEVSKTSFLSGSRCPLCAPKLSFEDVEAAVEECSPDWRVTRSKHRGRANLIMKIGGYTLFNLDYKQIIQDLKRERPQIFLDRIKRYEDKKSIRKTVYDEIAKMTNKKGFWEFDDGLCGHDVSPSERNIVQDICNLGLTERVGTGKYRIKKEQ